LIIQDALHAKLAANSALMAAIGNQLHWVAPNYRNTLPQTFIAYSLASRLPLSDELAVFGGIQNVRVDVACYSDKSIRAANDLAQSVKEILQGNGQTWSGLVVERCALADQSDITDREVLALGYFAVSQTFEITFKES
jgi:hypothetical protein